MDTDLASEALVLAEAAPTLRDAAQLLRERYAGLRVVVVDALDMRDEPPAACGDARVLWLGTCDGHCWQVTRDPARLRGLFIADRSRP